MSDIKLDTRELDRILRDSKLKAQQVINKLAFQIERRAKMLAPVDTGALRASIYTNTPGKSGFNGSIIGLARRGKKHARVMTREVEELPAAEEGSAIVGSPMSYATHVEYGTYKMGARPYLTPAVQTVVSQFNSGQTWQEVCK